MRGHRECGEWFARLNKELHQRGVKVVGHLNVKFLVGDPDSPEGPRGFFKFYRDQWDEKVLGPKPVADPLELLEKDKMGKPITPQDPATGKPIYGIGGMREYWGCLNNPHWRQVLRAWVRYGINQGLDRPSRIRPRRLSRAAPALDCGCLPVWAIFQGSSGAARNHPVITRRQIRWSLVCFPLTARRKPRSSMY